MSQTCSNGRNIGPTRMYGYLADEVLLAISMDIASEQDWDLRRFLQD